MYLNACKILKQTLIVFIATCPLLAIAQQGSKDNTVLSKQLHPADNSVKSITFSAATNWRPDQAQEVFNRYLGLNSANGTTMVLKNSITTKNNITTQRFEEYYKGVKVAFAGFTLTAKDNRLDFMTGNFYNPAHNPSSVPVLTPAEGLTRAISFVGAEKYKWQNPKEEAYIKKVHKKDTSYLPQGQLVWVEDVRSGNKDHKLHLAYSFDIYAEQPLSRQEVYIDATNGKVLFANQLLKHTAAVGSSRYSGVVPFQTANTMGTYMLFDSSRGDGVYTMNMENGTDYFSATDFTSITNTWPVMPMDNVALDAQWGGEKVYDYFFTEHGRLSWDGFNSILKQFVHYDVNYNNAFWDGSVMTYGDGTGIDAGGFTSLTSLDVTAHEIGHGVCQATCGLIYESESGALNEAFSDCWGATIENWADPHEIDAMPKNAWEMGEEISTEPLRSLNTPLLQGQPDTYNGTNWFNVLGCTPSSGNDNCGVHRNSGLMNYWYYLLVNGGSGVNDNSNSYAVSAMGWTKAANILYQSELVLSSFADYMDMRIASINAANIIYGPCSPEAQSVTTAWYAVGVGANYLPCAPQISFVTTVARISEAATTTTCPASRTLNIGLRPFGTVSGGNPVANIIIAPTSTAVLGVDYTLSTTSVSFTAGDPSTRFFTVTIFDNGAVNDNKHIDFTYTVSPMGSGAVVAPFNNAMTLHIDNNDSIPHSGGTLFPVLNEGIPVICDFTSPFYGSRRRAKSQFLLYANELTAAGVVPGVPVSQLAFNVLTKASTAPFIDFTISMRNTPTADLYSALVTGMTQVYTGNYTTTLGVNAINFNTGTFIWDGISNVAVQMCFGMNAAAFSDNDKVAGIQQGEFIIGNYDATDGGSGTGCPLGFNASNRAVIRPAMTFMQVVPPTTIETVAASNRIWNVRAGQEVYFYSTADTQVIAGIKDMDNNLGCVTAVVSQQGNGVMPATFSAINRSRKAITITPTINGSSTTYDVTFYMNNTELAGIDPSTLFLLKTDAPTDATISTANSLVITPSLITAGNYTGFRGTFTGFSRYMLVDGPLCNKPAAHITPGGPTSFCLGGTVVLGAPASASFNYQWQMDGIDIPGATASDFTASLGGVYRVTVNESVCDSVSLPVTVVLDSAYAAPVTGASSVCVGQNITLSDITPLGVWSTGDGAIATVSPAGIVTGIAPGTADISYAVTNACGTGTATHTVTVNGPSAVAPVTGTYTVCTGLSTTLSNATSGGVWSSGGAGIATVVPVAGDGVVTGVSAGTAVISYAYTNAFSCVAYATAVVSVNATPVATTSPAGAYVICSGSVATINAMPATAGHTYQWQTSSVSIPGATSDAFTTVVAGNYRVLVTSASGCTGTSADVNLSFSPFATVVPAVTVTSGAGLTMCASSAPVTFTAIPVNGGPTPLYAWSVNGAAVGGSTATYAYVPANGDIVACTLTSSAPCATPLTVSASVTMTVNAVVTPVVAVNPSPNDSVCTGQGVTYTATSLWGGTAPIYSWTENGIGVATGPSYATTPHNGDIIVCTMLSNYPCLVATTAVSAPFTMTVQSPTVSSVAISASVPVIIPGAYVTFVAVTTNAGPTPAYQWFINTVAIPGATNITFTTNALTNGQMVSCKVTSSLLCAAPRTILSGGFIVKITTGIEEVMADGSKLVLIPNPNHGTFSIMGEMGFVPGADVSVSVVNMLGQKVHEQMITTANGTLNETVTLPNNTAAGVYLVSVVSGSQRAVFHITVE